MTKTYKIGGAGRSRTNRVKLVEVLTRQKTGEILPQLQQPYAATMIQRHSRRHQNWLQYGRDMANFFNNIIRFKNIVLAHNPSIATKTAVKNNLVASIPLVGRTVARFLNKPELTHNITELRRTIKDDFTFPQRNTTQFNQLMSLLDDTQVIMDREIHTRASVPPIPQRANRARLSPTTTYDLALGLQRKGKHKGKTQRKNTKGKNKGKK